MNNYFKKILGGTLALCVSSMSYGFEGGGLKLTYASSECVTYKGGAGRDLWYSHLFNKSTSQTLTVDCPVHVASPNGYAGNISRAGRMIFRMDYLDRNNSRNISCALVSRNRNTTHYYSRKTSSGFSSDWKRFDWDISYDINSDIGGGMNHMYISCDIPPKDNNGNNMIGSYTAEFSEHN